MPKNSQRGLWLVGWLSAMLVMTPGANAGITDTTCAEGSVHQGVAKASNSVCIVYSGDACMFYEAAFEVPIGQGWYFSLEAGFNWYVMPGRLVPHADADQGVQSTYSLGAIGQQPSWAPTQTWLLGAATSEPYRLPITYTGHLCRTPQAITNASLAIATGSYEEGYCEEGECHSTTSVPLNAQGAAGRVLAP